MSFFYALILRDDNGYWEIQFPAIIECPDQSDIAPYLVPKPSEGKKVLPKEPDSDSAEIDEIMDDRGNWNS